MRETHLGAVDCAIAGALDDCEDVMVYRVEKDALDSSLSVSAAGLRTPQKLAARC